MNFTRHKKQNAPETEPSVSKEFRLGWIEGLREATEILTKIHGLDADTARRLIKGSLKEREAEHVKEYR